MASNLLYCLLKNHSSHLSTKKGGCFMDDPDSDANPAPLRKRLFFLFLHVLR